MQDHDDRPGGPDTAAQPSQGDAPESSRDAGQPTDEPDPTFADGTAREFGDDGQPLTRQDEGMDR